MHDLLLLIIIVGLFALIPYFDSFLMLILIHCLLGVLFAYIRIRSETRFLAFCPVELLGRLRANSLFIVNIMGLVIFAIPTLCAQLSIPSLYLLSAFVIALLISFLLVLVNMNFYKAQAIVKS